MDIFQKDDVSLSYYTKGSGQEVLLLHGFPDTSALWDKQADAISSNGFKVIVPDVKGFGASSKPKEVEAYKLKTVADDMFALLDHLNVDRVILVGHDWGAFLTWHMVSSRPERCRKVVVLSCGHAMSFFPAGGIEQRQKSWYMLLFQDQQAEALLTANDWALWKNLMGTKSPDNKLAAEQIQNMSKEGALTAGLNWYRANISLKHLALTEAPKLPKLNVPIMGIWSSHDYFLTEEQMKASEQYIEDGLFYYKRIEGASHWMQKDAPEELNEALLEFFRK